MSRPAQKKQAPLCASHTKHELPQIQKLIAQQLKEKISHLIIEKKEHAKKAAIIIEKWIGKIPAKKS